MYLLIKCCIDNKDCSGRIIIKFMLCENIHYKRFKKCGDPLYIKPIRLCNISNCGEKHRRNGLCVLHSSQTLKVKTRQKAYRKSEIGSTTRKAYENSSEGRASIKRWQKSPKAKVVNKKYNTSTKGKARRKVWVNTEPGRIWYKKNKLKKYNLKPEEFDQMVKNQNNKCAICRKPEKAKQNDKIKDIAIDHITDSKPIIVRDLLCQNCNLELGHYEKFMANKKLTNIADTYLSECFNILDTYTPVEELLKNNKEFRDILADISKWKVYRLKTKYDLTPEQFTQMIICQNNRCAICRNPETVKQNDKIKELAIDHDHKTGKVRGLLCSNCNTMLAYYEKFKNNKELCEIYDAYILKHSNNNLKYSKNKL